MDFKKFSKNHSSVFTERIQNSHNRLYLRATQINILNLLGHWGH